MIINKITNEHWGNPVLERFMKDHDLIMYFGTHENIVTSTIGRRNSSLVLRVLTPGSRIDTVVMGEGVTTFDSYTKLIKSLETGKGLLCLKSARGSVRVLYPGRVK